jgi:Tfp pilus assembly protein PilF
MRRKITTEKNTDEFGVALGLFSQAESLTKVAVKELERALKENPNNLENRLLLIGYYKRKQSTARHLQMKALLKHLSWMIDTYPDNKILSFVPFQKQSPEFKIAKKHWNKAIKREPLNFQILYNAGLFCRLAEPKAAKKYFQLGLLTPA